MAKTARRIDWDEGSTQVDENAPSSKAELGYRDAMVASRLKLPRIVRNSCAVEMSDNPWLLVGRDHGGPRPAQRGNDLCQLGKSVNSTSFPDSR